MITEAALASGMTKEELDEALTDSFDERMKLIEELGIEID